MASKEGLCVAFASLIAQCLLTACSQDHGKIKVGFDGEDRPFIKSISGEDGLTPCISSVFVYEDGPVDQLVREFYVTQKNICIRSIGLNEKRFLVKGTLLPIERHSGKRYHIDVVGVGLETQEMLETSELQ